MVHMLLDVQMIDSEHQNMQELTNVICWTQNVAATKEHIRNSYI